MFLPYAAAEVEVRKRRLERGIFGTAGVYAELYTAFGAFDMADAHLIVGYAVDGAFNQKVVPPAA